MVLLLSSLSGNICAMEDDGSGIGNGEVSMNSSSYDPSLLQQKPNGTTEGENKEPADHIGYLSLNPTDPDTKIFVEKVRKKAQTVEPNQNDKAEALGLSEEDLESFRQRQAELDDQARIRRLAELGRKYEENPTLTLEQEKLIELGKKARENPFDPVARGNAKDFLAFQQGLLVKKKIERENETVWQHLNRAEVTIGLAVTFGAPVFDLFVKRYGDRILGAIEQKLGFGPSKQEEAMMMQQMMSHMEFQKRRNQAEINEKELKVSILRAIRKKQDLEAEKEELQLDTVKAKKYLLDDIVELTREKIKQGPNFPANKLKELNELKALYKEEQMIDKELQDLKRASNPGVSIPGMA